MRAVRYLAIAERCGAAGDAAAGSLLPSEAELSASSTPAG